jgi:hypothetical protein
MTSFRRTYTIFIFVNTMIYLNDENTVKKCVTFAVVISEQKPSMYIHFNELERFYNVNRSLAT